MICMDLLNIFIENLEYFLFYTFCSLYSQIIVIAHKDLFLKIIGIEFY